MNLLLLLSLLALIATAASFIPRVGITGLQVAVLLLTIVAILISADTSPLIAMGAPSNE